MYDISPNTRPKGLEERFLTILEPLPINISIPSLRVIGYDTSDRDMAYHSGIPNLLREVLFTQDQDLKEICTRLREVKGTKPCYRILILNQFFQYQISNALFGSS